MPNLAQFLSTRRYTIFTPSKYKLDNLTDTNNTNMHHPMQEILLYVFIKEFYF